MTKDLFDSFSYKIKTLANLEKILKTTHVGKKIILCHGNFDVVHPGHVRHLLYAKSKADILIVSVTADRHIKKGIYRPHVPQDLRSLNIAAFQMVDYVMIDDEATPIKIIKKLKPDFFAKGYEYNAAGVIHEESKKEMEIVESYGGEMIFSPGDVVYSSSKLLNISLPDIHIDQIISVMRQANLKFDYLKKILNNISKLNVHVLGDTIVDTYTRTSLIGGQIKTPTLSLLFHKKENFVGGAAIVAQHIKASGAKVTFTTILGNDSLKDMVIRELKSKKIAINTVIIPSRPTTHKNVIISNDYRLLKIDTLDNQPVNEKIILKLCNYLKKVKTDGVFFSDFRHGIFHSASIDKLTSSIGKKIFKVADSQVATRWGNISEFKNFDIIFPNEKEARFCLADQDSNISNLSRRILEKTKCKNLILKLRERGMFGVSQKVKQKDNYSFSLPGLSKNVLDPIGAGDAMFAYTTLSMIASSSLAASSIIGSAAAACACEKDGNLPILKGEIIKKIEELEKISHFKYK